MFGRPICKTDWFSQKLVTNYHSAPPPLINSQTPQKRGTGLLEYRKNFSQNQIFVIITSVNTDTLFNLIASINYAAVLLISVSVFYWIYVFVVIYHLVRFGIGLTPKILALIFLAGSVMFFTTALVLYYRVDLDQLFANIRPDNFFELPQSNF